MHDSPVPAKPERFPLQSLTERMRRQNAGSTVPDRVIVEEVVLAVLDTMNGRISPTEAMLLREIADLGRIIQEAKSGIAEVSLDAITDSHIPYATGELDAIIEHTAIATNSILESCEVLDKLAGTMDRDQADRLHGATTNIYEACSFQDITGQRITKVVKALQSIERKVLALSARYAQPGDLSGTPHQPIAYVHEEDKDALLNGPMLPHEAMCQDDIDKLLADFA